MSKEGYLASAVSPTRANSWLAKGKALGEGSMADIGYMGIFRNRKIKKEYCFSCDLL